jgi:hypothetical protein
MPLVEKLALVLLALVHRRRTRLPLVMPASMTLAASHTKLARPLCAIRAQAG